MEGEVWKFLDSAKTFKGDKKSLRSQIDGRRLNSAELNDCQTEETTGECSNRRIHIVRNLQRSGKSRRREDGKGDEI